MKRVAAPMIGGLVTSAFITLEVIPVLYTIWRYRQLRLAPRTGVPLEKIAGPTPAWAGDHGDLGELLDRKRTEPRRIIRARRIDSVKGKALPRYLLARR